MELNPNHPVTVELRQQWHKLCALAMHVLGVSIVSITTKDIEDFEKTYGRGAGVIAHPKGDQISLMLVTRENAERAAKKAGGGPF